MGRAEDVATAEGVAAEAAAAEAAVRVKEVGQLLGSGRVEEGAGEGSGREFRVVLIKEGLSTTGRYYTRRCVEEIAGAAEGLRAFADHATAGEARERPARSVRDMVGFFVDGRVNEGGEAEATLRMFEGAEWLAAMAREVVREPSAGEVIGLSIDAMVSGRAGRVPGVEREVLIAESLVELYSVDVVTRAGAGGRFLEMKESEGMTMETGMQAGTDVTAGGEKGEEKEVSAMGEVKTMETAAGAASGGEVKVGGAKSGEDAAATAAQAAVEEAQGVLAEVRERGLLVAEGRALEERLAAAVKLPAASKERLRRLMGPAAGDAARFGSLDGYVKALEAAVADEAAAVDAVRTELKEAATSAGGGKGLNLVTDGGVVTVNESEAEVQRLVAQVAMDRLLGYEGGEEDAEWKRARELGLLAGLPRWGGIREAYVQITGDALVSGQVRPEGSLVREANEVTTGVLNHALLNSMTKRLVMDYRGQPREWRRFCSVVPLANFKSQDRVRLHDFSSLSTVAEGAAYSNLAWDDSREAYAPAKRGNLVVVTREAILNDDLRAITRIPQKVARAAHITINEFVYGLFTGNPTMADGTKVFDDGVQTSHANRGTAVLSSNALQAAITSMMKQTDTAGKRLNLKPRYLLVPADLLFAALTIVNSTMIPGSANNDANVLKGAVEPIPVAQLTDPTDWYLICDPKDIESIEIGFVGGREEPELLLQDAPLLGQVFTNDQMSFKVRWEFGGAWLDYRGAFWSQAAG